MFSHNVSGRDHGIVNGVEQPEYFRLTSLAARGPVSDGGGRPLSALRPVVDHKHVIQHRANDLAEGFVLRMLDVGVAVLFALE